jgi:hypothetical protein
MRVAGKRWFEACVFGFLIFAAVIVSQMPGVPAAQPGPGLTEQEKDHIRQEEVFRAEVRRSLAEEVRSTGDSIVGFLNSAFGLWLLSSVFVTGLTAVWTMLKTRREKRRRVEERLASIRLEVAFRLMAFDDALESYVAESGQRYANAIAKLVSGSHAVLPEFAGWSTEALLMQALMMVPKSGRDAVTALIHATHDVEHAITTKEGHETLDGTTVLDSKARAAALKTVVGPITNDLRKQLNDWNP